MENDSSILLIGLQLTQTNFRLIRKKNHAKNITYNLNENLFKCEDEAKLLSVTIDYQLKFNTHIANICEKASNQLKVLK